MISRRLDKFYRIFLWPSAGMRGEFFPSRKLLQASKYTVIASRTNLLVRPEMGKFVTLRLYSQKPHTCSECGSTSVSTFKCSKCDSLLLPSEETTLFDVLGQKMSYDLIESELKTIHRKLQTEFHPDKFSQKNSSERVKSEEISALINKAYFTLSNPYERGMYLLHLKNHPVHEGDIQLGTDFLASIMESNEELEEISTREELEKFGKSNDDEIRKLSSLISKAFVDNNLPAAKADLNKMKYFISIRNRLKEIERNMM